MKRQSYLTIVALVTTLVLGQVNTAFAQQKRSVLIGFNGPSTRQAADDRANAVRSLGGDVHHAFHVIPVVSAELPEAAIAQLRTRADVTYVEDDIEWHAMGQNMPWGINRIHAPSAWSVATGAGVNVAVLDTGVDYDHEDLADNFAGGVNWVGNGKNDGSTDPSLYDDVYGHGTHCAGVIAAADNGIGVVGVAPEARIWAVKVLSDSGGGRITDIAQGIEWCIDKGDIQVISMSLGGAYSTTQDNACAAAYAANILIVASAGNDGGPVHYPAGYESVMAVSAINISDQLASFSNFGPEIELAAPGGGILSTVPGDGYASMSGTSMACPHVSGVAALLWQSMSSASSIRDQLKATAEDIGLSEDEQGAGLVDAAAAVGVSVEPIVDIAITSMVAQRSVVVQGDLAYVLICVTNVGDQDVSDTITVMLTDTYGTDAPTTIGSRDISGLATGALVWVQIAYHPTTSYTPGDHTLTASHDFDDGSAVNNTLSTTITIEKAIYDIAITSVSAPSSVIQGDPVSVDVTVANVGNRSVSSDIAVTLGDESGVIPIGSQMITSGLGVGDSTTLTFSWDTTTAGPGDHILTASHDFADDDAGEPGNNNSSQTTVTVTEPGSVKYMYASVGFTPAGPHLKIIITVEDEYQAPVSGIWVDADLATPEGAWLADLTGTTDSAGQISFTLKGGKSGSYEVTVWDLVDTRDPVAYVADGLPVVGTWPLP